MKVLPINFFDAKPVQNDYETISLIIQYLNNELPKETSEAIKEQIEKCEKCRKIYEEVKSFFSTEDIFMFEFMNEKKIEKTRRKIRRIATEYTNIELNENLDIYDYDDWDERCLSCGS